MCRFVDVWVCGCVGLLSGWCVGAVVRWCWCVGLSWGVLVCVSGVGVLASWCVVCWCIGIFCGGVFLY